MLQPLTQRDRFRRALQGPTEIPEQVGNDEVPEQVGNDGKEAGSNESASLDIRVK